MGLRDQLDIMPLKWLCMPGLRQINKELTEHTLPVTFFYPTNLYSFETLDYKDKAFICRGSFLSIFGKDVIKAPWPLYSSKGMLYNCIAEDTQSAKKKRKRSPESSQQNYCEKGSFLDSLRVLVRK